MKKNLLKIIGTVLSLILGFSSTVIAQETTTETEKMVDGGVYRSWELKAGMKIALRGANKNNGKQWLSATENNFKSGAFNDGCVFVIEAANTNGKFVLKHENQYIAAATAVENDPITFTPDKSAAAEFTFSCPTNNDFINDDTKQWPDDGFDYNNNMFVRLTTTYDGGNTYLNTNSTDLKPKFHNGTQGFSAWLVYSVGDPSKSCQAKKMALTNLDFLTDGTLIMFKDMNSSTTRQGWLYEGDDNKISTTQYEPTNSLNSSRYIWTVNKVDGGYTFTNLATGRWMRFDNSSNTTRKDNTNVNTKNDGEKGVFSITQGSEDHYWQISSNGQFFNGDDRSGETGGFNTWNGAHDYEIYPIYLQGVQIHNVDIQYIFKNGYSLKAETSTAIKQGENFTFSAPEIENNTIQYYMVGDTRVETTEKSYPITSDVTVKYVYDFTVFPFESSNISGNTFPEDIKWSRLTLKGDYLKYNEGATYISLESESNSSYNDEFLWAFNIKDNGTIEIYNKAAGANKVLSSASPASNELTYPTMIDKNAIPEGNNSAWDITSSTSISGKNGFFLDRAGDEAYKLNHRSGKLAYWNTGANEGSTFVVYDANEEFVKNFEIFKQYQIGTGIGKYTDSQEGTFTTLLNQAETNMPETLSGKNELLNQLTEAAGNLVINQPETGKFYRFKNKVNNNYISSTGTADARPNMVDGGEDASTVFYLSDDKKLTGSNLLNMSNYNFAGTNTGSETSFLASSVYPGCYVIRNSETSYYGVATGSQLDRWNDETESLSKENCAWTLEEVTEATQQPNLSKSIGTTGYATLGAPVALNIPKSVKAYTVTVSGNNTKANLNEIKGNIIPAGVGVVLKAESTSTDFTFTFNSGADAPTIAEGDNALTPLYTETTIDSNVNAYILAYESEGLGFYLLDPNERTVDANKAYIELPQTVNAVRSILFGGPTTGIEGSVTADSEKVEYYDLQGRRVMTPGKGIYITNSGKKVIFTK